MSRLSPRYGYFMFKLDAQEQACAFPGCQLMISAEMLRGAPRTKYCTKHGILRLDRNAFMRARISALEELTKQRQARHS